MWTVVKMGSIGVRFAYKKGVIIQADDIDRPLWECPPPGGHLNYGAVHMRDQKNAKKGLFF